MMSRKNLLILVIIALVIVFYLARHIMLPFVLAAVFAYIFNPVVDLMQERLRIKRFVSVIMLFIILIGLISYSSFWVVSKISAEASEIKNEISNFNSFGLSTLNNLPEWDIGGHVFGVKTLILANLNSVVGYVEKIQDSFIPIVSSVLSYTLKLLVFIVASFYLLKDGKKIMGKLGNQFPEKTFKGITEVAHKINISLGGYLRGQIILIIFMASVSSIILTVLGVKYSIILGILTGFLELIPFIGPVVATAIVATIAFVTGENRVGLDPSTLALAVVIIYFVLRQLEDYFVVPQLLGRLTRLHPLLILFSILAGGAIAGPIGFIISVPLAASARVLLEYYWTNSV